MLKTFNLFSNFNKVSLYIGEKFFLISKNKLDGNISTADSGSTLKITLKIVFIYSYTKLHKLV